MDSQNGFAEFDRVSTRLLEMLSSLHYGKDTITIYRRILKRIKAYMEHCDHAFYSENIGAQFLKDHFSKGNFSYSYTRALQCTVRRLNDVYFEKGYINRHTKRKDVPPSQWSTVLSEYLLRCEQKGNHKNSIKIKYHFCTCFLKALSNLGLQDFSDMESGIIIRACLQLTDKGAYAVVRQFLVYLYETSVVCTDYSHIIPRYIRPIKLPSVYSLDEIRRLECAVDQSTAVGIRNYAILLLASRMGMRSGDIVALQFKSLDFQHDRICFYQGKTGKEQELPLIPEMKCAIQKYLESARPSDDSTFVFINTRAPYTPLTTSAIRSMLKDIFIAADVGFQNRKHGAHSLRASLASSLVNDDVPYEAVRKILGHTDPRSITHYAKIDLDNLRLYALEAPSPSGNFETYLSGRALQ